MNNTQELAFCACLRYLAKCHTGLTKPNPEEYRASSVMVNSYIDHIPESINLNSRSALDGELLLSNLKEFISDRMLANKIETEDAEVHQLLKKFTLNTTR